MSEDKPNEPKKSETAKVVFEVADHWPLRGVGRETKDKAVQALVAAHTLIVGQSRSGKSMAARRLIEEILTWTDARVVILDPNADFRFLKDVDPKLDRAIPDN